MPIKILIGAVAFALVVAVWVVGLMSIPTTGKTYRCELSEISPDFAVNVREACRQQKQGS